MSPQSLLSPVDVAQRLNVTAKTVIGLLRSGRLVGNKVGRQWRVQAIEIDRFMVRSRFQPAPTPSARTRAARTARRMHATELQLPGASEFL